MVAIDTKQSIKCNPLYYFNAHFDIYFPVKSPHTPTYVCTIKLISQHHHYKLVMVVIEAHITFQCFLLLFCVYSQRCYSIQLSYALAMYFLPVYACNYLNQLKCNKANELKNEHLFSFCPNKKERKKFKENRGFSFHYLFKCAAAVL